MLENRFANFIAADDTAIRLFVKNVLTALARLGEHCICDKIACGNEKTTICTRKNDF